MNYVLDGALLLVIALTIYVYYKRGFVKAVLGFGKTLLSYICAVAFGRIVGGYLAERFFDENITNIVYNTLEKHNMGDQLEKVPESLRVVAEKCGVDVDSLISNASGQEWIQEASTRIGIAISSVVSVLAGYVLVFVVAYLVFLLGAFILEALVELPVLRSLNHLLGLCLGCLCAIVFAFLFVLFIKVIIYYLAASGDREIVLETIDKTYLFKFFSEMGRGIIFK